MSVSANKSRLVSITRELMAKWEQTQESWRDAKAQEFEKRYLDELRASVDTSLGVIDQLDKLLTRIRHDCE